MLFDTPTAGRTNRARGAVVSTAVHVALLALAVAVARYEPAEHGADPAVDRPSALMVWIPTDAPAGGGGGGAGNARPEPPRAARAPGRDALTVRPSPPVEAAHTATPPREPEPTLALSAEPLSAGEVPLVGVFEPSRAAEAEALGPGDGRGTNGPEDGPGSGTGQGPGDGPGRGGERGEVGPPGNGVSWPRLLRDVKPAYTAEAMRARITGSVGLSCVVERDGSVRDCRLTRSLDRHHGLDEAALRAARQWKFVPARRIDEPVAVRVAIDMDFTLR
jgi:periplasmic protein TonB